jgi:hypothetical protein
MIDTGPFPVVPKVVVSANIPRGTSENNIQREHICERIFWGSERFIRFYVLI